MKNNKSIDGLSTRDAKKSASSSVKRPTPSKSSVMAPRPKTVKPRVSTKAPLKATSNTVKARKTPVSKPTSVKVNTKPKSTSTVTSTIITDEIDNNPIEIEVFSDDKQPLTPSPKSDSKPTKSHEQTVEDFLAPVSAFNFGDDDTPDTSEDNTKVPMGKLKYSNLQEDTSSTKDNKKSTKKANFKKAPSKARKVISIIALIIVTLIIGAVIWLLIWGNDIIAKITGGQGNLFDLFSLMDEKYEPLKTDKNGRTNILAFGTSGYDMDGTEGNGTHDGAQLTDSIMLISLDQETGDVAMLSLPRDLKASPTCTATSKINEVYWCNNMDGNNEEAGATALMSEVGTILGIDIQYYAHLNWASLSNIVDILGGITVTLDEDIHDYYYTKAVYEAGVEYTINGAEAVGLARARHGTAGGDFSRGASQQKILIGIKNKIFEKELTLSDILGLASTLGDNLRTNLSVEELKTAAHLTYDFDFNNMRELTLYPDYMTTGTINGISYVLPKGGVGNYGAIQEYVNKMLSSDPRNYEDPTIIILNASDTIGLASTEQEKLENAGFTITDIDNAPLGEYNEGYTIYSTTTKPGTKKLLEDQYNIESLPIEQAPVEGYDFVIVLNPSTEVSE